MRTAILDRTQGRQEAPSLKDIATRTFRGLRNAFLLATVLASVANAQPTFTKVFTPDTIGPGAVSMLTFTITNGSATPVTDLDFTDILPAGITIADPAIASTDCVDPVLSAPAGGGTIVLSDGDVPGSSACTVMLQVTSSTPGTHMNTSGALTSSAGNSGTATDDLTVATDRPGFSKSFAPSSVSLGGRSTLTFTIDNSANASFALSLSFTDNLPVGMEIASPANASSTCTFLGTPVLTAVPGSSVVSHSAGGVATEGTCMVSVDVVATGDGLLDNVSGELTSIDGSLTLFSSGKAAATLDVTATTINLTKSFTDDPVPPGGTVTLEFTIENFDRNFSATGIAFTDDLGAALSGLTFDSLLASDCGGSVSGAGGTTIALTGGTVAPEGSCTISASLSVPAAAVPDSYTNTTGAITADVDGSLVTGNIASDDLFVSPIPILTKEFTDDPVVPGGDVTLRFTITNTSTTSAATDIAFLDELTTFLPFPVSVMLPGTACGGSISLILIDTDREGLSLTGGSLAAAPGAGSTCTFDVTVTVPGGQATGDYVNTSEEITATVDGATRTGDPATDTLRVIAAPSLSKAFTDDPVAPGGTVTLEFTLTHSSNATTDATGITFTDDLVPVLAGLTANLPPTPDPPCGAGSSLTSSAGDTLLTLMGGTLSPGDFCTFSVTLNVPVGATAGSHSNTTSMVMATVESLMVTSAPATDDLTVSGLMFSKEFIDDPVIPGDTVTLRFTIDNNHPTDDATITSFTDSLSAVLTGLAATGGPTMDDCGGTLSGTTFLIYTGGSVMSGTSCTIEVPVLVPGGASDGTFGNVTSSLSATLGGTPVTVDPATDDLIVNSNLLFLTKEFTDDPILPGGTGTLEFTLTNLDPSEAASSIDFTDNLDDALTGLVWSAVLGNDCTGSTVMGIGTGLLTFSGGSLAAGGTCTISVMISVPVGAPLGSFPNTTSDVTGTIGGLAVTGFPKTDNLDVGSLVLTKSFGSMPEPGDTVTLTFTIENLSTTDIQSDLGFTDDLDAVISGLQAIGLPMPNACGAGSVFSGTSDLVLTGGALLPLGSCSIPVTVQVPAGASLGSFLNTSSDLFQTGLPVAPPAAATLVVTGQITNVVTVTADGATPAVGQTTDTILP